MYTGRVDTNPTANDKAFVHFKYDNGVQPTYTDPINAAFDADSQQPDYEGQLSETHSFGTRAVNVFLMTGSYYSALFVNPDPSKELSTFPMEMEWFDGFANTLNNNALAWPEGRNVTQYQFGDDFSYTKGKHTMKAGVAFKKDDVSDFDTGVLQTPLVFTDQAYGDFQSGQSLLGVQNFTTNLDLPLSLYTLGFYVQDQWKPISKATVTAGIRVERNSNVACRKNCLANFGGDFFSLASGAPLNSTSGAYNQQIKSGLQLGFHQLSGLHDRTACGLQLLARREDRGAGRLRYLHRRIPRNHRRYHAGQPAAHAGIPDPWFGVWRFDDAVAADSFR